MGVAQKRSETARATSQGGVLIFCKSTFFDHWQLNRIMLSE
jgi:hypothetical protein